MVESIAARTALRDRGGNMAKMALAWAALFGLVAAAPASAQPDQSDGAKVRLEWGVQIPMRDGTRLNATVYRPKAEAKPDFCVFTLTPYISESYHERGIYFAAHGVPFLTVDVRGRGNSEGQFRPLIAEGDDGRDVAEWLARQPECNGKVSMWGGSYAGHDQWATAVRRPAGLATIVPVASPWAGVDFPFQNNVTMPYVFQWMMFTGGKALQPNLAFDSGFWNAMLRDRFEKGLSFRSLGQSLGGDQAVLKEWLDHPMVDEYWDSYNATPEQLAALDIPILSITGSYDGDQPGALKWYDEHMKAATPEQKARHFLIIGPWDHAGTRTPRAEFGGLKMGPASLIDMNRLHLDWYRWTMANGPKPDFLKKPVAYYVMGADTWRHADSLAAVTARETAYFLDSAANADKVMASGSLAAADPGKGKPDSYVYDPRDVSLAALESEVDPTMLNDQRLVLAKDGRQLVYHSAPFDRPTEISGFFKLKAWIAIDQPDTDIQATVYEIDGAGNSIQLSSQVIRARYRESLREARLVTTTKPLLYDFDRFTFVSRQIAKGSRLRLVVGPINSMFVEKNFNSGKTVADETMADARAVKVSLFHDRAHPSALYIPFGHP
ncbi:CocE/NonD family hydrolase [Sphingosinicella rhizophila]|uniref:CocE/NonD family hydrolase n=1 Tax=Sphingosinicella rhizophila TaxID=3050082 RepID=A0ABU3Q9J7_9SPHN|nr:CocE/NonD family hydrolase [Sphingosinicella sp. GR2756]MDT9600080.1 CocE/NonD family hydrolase [Sphingosinicella sp. GR2756]